MLLRNNIPVKNVKMGPNWSIDLAALRKVATAEAKKHRVLVYLVNPNNPTSTIADSNEIFNWIKSQPKNTFFILDEAYAAKEGLGAALLPIPLGESEKSLTRLLPNWTGVPVEVCAITSSRKISSAARNFIDLAKQEFNREQ